MWDPYGNESDEWRGTRISVTVVEKAIKSGPNQGELKPQRVIKITQFAQGYESKASK